MSYVFGDVGRRRDANLDVIRISPRGFSSVFDRFDRPLGNRWICQLQDESVANFACQGKHFRTISCDPDGRATFCGPGKTNVIAVVVNRFSIDQTLEVNN